MITNGRDLSHYNRIGDYDAAREAVDWVHIKVSEDTAFVDPLAATHYRGFDPKPRGAYHFAQLGDVRVQVAHFLATKASIGKWQRNDMLDCEFAGVTGAFIAELVAEHRRQSGAERRYVYAGVNDLKGPCDPDLWLTPDVDLWVPRYRKTGQPEATPAGWGSYLGFWHPSIRVVQYDNATPLPGGGNTDISDEIEEDYSSQEVSTDMSGIQLYPATDPAKPGRGTKALPGPAADPGTRCYVTTGWGNEIALTVWFLAENGGYLGKAGGRGYQVRIHSDAPGWFPVPANTVAIHAQWTSTMDIPGDLEIRYAAA